MTEFGFQDRVPNPLRQFFREPGVYIKLPTKAAFYAPGEVELTATGEIPIYPMTAFDELTLKNPDALLNGDAVEKIMASCAPSVKNPRNLCSPDVDAILLAIRASTYGDEIEYETKCPSCENENRFVASIRYVLETITFHEDEYPIKVGNGITVYVKPRPFSCTTKAAVMAFEQAKMVQEVQKAETLDELEKNRIFRESFEKVSRMNLEMIADAIHRVVIPQGVVTETVFIAEWLANVDMKTVQRIEQKIEEITPIGINKMHSVTCPKCQHEWQTAVIYDPSYFFG